MRKPHVCLLIFLALACSVGGCIGGGYIGATLAPSDKPRAVYAPLPHHVPLSADSPSFRFAMVHDVIHERYSRHGDAFYEERERLARERVTGFHPDSETAFALTDDIAVGKDRRGKLIEAIAMMRDKLKRQEALGLKGKELYSSYANLAEFLLHGHLWGMMKGEFAARQGVKEARDLIRKSIEANPKAHFGRESWQLVAIETLIEFGNSAEGAKKTDLIGNRLDVSIKVTSHKGTYEHLYADTQHVMGRPYQSDWSTRVNRGSSETGVSPDGLEETARIDLRERSIAHVGRESPVEKSHGSERGKRASFDEPALWLIGEWRQGSGPNPHFAMCLGEIMLRVGQRYLAWSCFERATRMSEQFWPTAALQEFLRTHCRERQQSIEKSLPESETAMLRPNFDREFAFGLKYQQEYQAFAEQQIQAGKNLNDRHFFEEFHASHPPIASKVGPEEWYAGERSTSATEATMKGFFSWGPFTGGACLLLSSLLMNWLFRSRPNPLNLKEISLPKTHQPPQRLDPLRPDAADPS